MANSNGDKWYFTKEQLENTPSRKCGFDSYKELSYRQRAADLIQNIGQTLKLSQLCTNTAIVYMHRFYVFHSFTQFAWHQIAAAALLLAAKIEEQHRKVHYIVQVAHMCRHPGEGKLDANSERYKTQCEDIVYNEHILLQTLGFDLEVDHPHGHVVRCCHLVKASKEIAQSSYLMASNSLHLTTMCLQYKPTVVACFCILVACRLSNWKIPISKEKREWYSYVDPTVTPELIQQLTEEFLVIFEAFPSRLKKIRVSLSTSFSQTSTNSNSSCDSDTYSLRLSQESRSDPETDHKDRPRLHHTHQPQWRYFLSSGNQSSNRPPPELKDHPREAPRRPLVGIAATKLRHKSRNEPKETCTKSSYRVKPITYTDVRASTSFESLLEDHRSQTRRVSCEGASSETDRADRRPSSVGIDRRLYYKNRGYVCRPAKPVMIKVDKDKLRPLPGEASVREPPTPPGIGILREKINECSISGCCNKRLREVSPRSVMPRKIVKTEHGEVKENGRDYKEEAVRMPP